MDPEGAGAAPRRLALRRLSESTASRARVPDANGRVRYTQPRKPPSDPSGGRPDARVRTGEAVGGAGEGEAHTKGCRVTRWTPAQDAVLRERFHSASLEDIAAAVGRTPDAVRNRAERLRILKRPMWSDRDTKLLRAHWGEVPLVELAAKLGRTPSAVYQHGLQIGLHAGCPDHHEYLFHAAERTGYHLATLWQILRWARVKVHALFSWDDNPRTHTVDPFDVDEAVKRFLANEKPGAAARARGVTPSTLRRRLRAVTALKPPARRRHWRVPSEVIDAVLASTPQRQRKAAA